MSTDQQAPEIQMDANGLYREDVFSDQRVGSIRQMTPVKADGSVDNSRPTQYLGSAQILTPAGALPLNFEIEAETLADAVDRFGASAQVALEKTMEELKEMRRQASSSIVVPGMEGGGMPGAGMPGGGMPGGGLKLP